MKHPHLATQESIAPLRIALDVDECDALRLREATAGIYHFDSKINEIIGQKDANIQVLKEAFF